MQKGWIYFHAKNDPILATFDTTPSPHWRINAAGLILAFTHIHGEAGTPTVGIRSALVSRNGPVLCACAERKGGFSCKIYPTILATFDTTPSPHWRINAASLILAFAHIHGEAGAPALGIRSAVVSRNGPVLSAERKGGFLCKK